MLKMNAKTIIIHQLKLTGESVDSLINHSGQHVELLRAEERGVEDALHVAGSEGPASEGHRGEAVVQSWSWKVPSRALMIGALNDKVPGMIATIRVKREVKRGAMSWARMMAANTTTKMGMRSVSLPRSRPASSCVAT